MLAHIRCSRLSIMLALMVFVVPSAVQSLAQDDQSEEQLRGDAAARKLLRILQEEQKERDRRAYARFLASAELTDQNLATLLTRTQTFAARMATLLTNDEGKRIAHDPTAFMMYLRLEKEPVTTVDEVKARKAASAAIVERLKADQQNIEVGYQPSEELEREVDELYYWAKDRLAVFGAHDETLDSIIADAPKEIDLAKAKTLTAALTDYRARWPQVLAESKILGEELAAEESKMILIEAARAAELEKALEERDRLQRETTAQIERARLDFELQLQHLKREEQERRVAAEIAYKDAMAELERFRKQAEADRYAEDVRADLKKDETVAAAERERKIALANSTEVQQLLAPFLAQGYSQPEQKPSTTRGPVSLAALRSAGALDPTDKGLRVLHRLGTKKQEDRDRPRWGFASYYERMSAEQRAQLQQAQDYLNDLGAVMVELGLLAP